MNKYSQNNKERERIAKNGYRKVLENHTQHHGKDKTFAELSRKHGMILSELQEIPAALKSLEASIESYIKIDNPEDDESIVEHYDYYLTVISLSMVYRKAGDYASAYLFLSAINKMNDLPFILAFTTSASFLFSKFFASKIDFCSLKKSIFSFLVRDSGATYKSLVAPEITSFLTLVISPLFNEEFKK